MPPASHPLHERGTPGSTARPGQISPATRQRLRDTLLTMSISLLSGPGGLAACLRATTLGAPYTSRSQPLDIGRSTRTVPPHLRKAVIHRDRHCQFPGCGQPPARCDAHHLIHWSQGGPTSLGNLRLLCTFHHLVVIHRWGWTLDCHPTAPPPPPAPTDASCTPTGHPLAAPREGGEPHFLRAGRGTQYPRNQGNTNVIEAVCHSSQCGVRRHWATATRSDGSAGRAASSGACPACPECAKRLVRMSHEPFNFYLSRDF